MKYDIILGYGKKHMIKFGVVNSRKDADDLCDDLWQLLHDYDFQPVFNKIGYCESEEVEE